MGIFDIGDAHAFFHSIKYTYARYRRGTVKSTEDLLYIIMGLNNLREWIAPDYNLDNKKRLLPEPRNDAQAFSKEIYECLEHKIVRELCNQTKHLGKEIRTSTSHEALFDDAEDIDSLQNFDLGPPTDHYVDERPIEECIEPLIQKYEAWFKPAAT